jgi:hypothetical protein
VDDILELYVHSPCVRQEVRRAPRGLPRGPLFDDSELILLPMTTAIFWRRTPPPAFLPSSPLATMSPSSRHHLYYFGIRGPRRRGPKLIFRTSKDVFTAPSGPENAILVSCSFGQSTSTKNLARTICGLLFVLRFVIFSKRSNLRTDIRSKVVKLLDQRTSGIRPSTSFVSAGLRITRTSRRTRTTRIPRGRQG